MGSTTGSRIVIPICLLAGFLLNPSISAERHVVNTKQDCIRIKNDYLDKASKVHENRESLSGELTEIRQKIDVSKNVREWLRVGEEYSDKKAALDKKYSEIHRVGQKNVRECYRILRAQKLEQQKQHNTRLIEIKKANDLIARMNSERAVNLPSTMANEAAQAWSQKAATHSVFGKNVTNLRYVERLFVANSALNALDRVLNGDRSAMDDLAFSSGKIASSAIPERGIASFISNSGLSIINSVYTDLFTELDRQFNGVDSNYESYRKALIETASGDVEKYQTSVQSGEIDRLRASIRQDDLIGKIRSTNRDWFHENPIKKAERARIQQIAEQKRLQSERAERQRRQRERAERERLERERVASQGPAGYQNTYDPSELNDSPPSNSSSGWGSFMGDLVEAVGGAYIQQKRSNSRARDSTAGDSSCIVTGPDGRKYIAESCN